MIKTIKKIALSSALIATVVLWTGCSDEFLQEKKDYSKLTPDIYNDYVGAKMRVDDIYLRLLPNANDGYSYRSPSAGKSDILSQSTEEYTGLSKYVNPEMILTSSSNLDDWFHVSKNTRGGPWSEIRNCNDAIEGITASTLEEGQKNELLGQVYFFRAWQYYLLVKTYGGVPIIDEVQVTDVSQADDMIVPRSTTKACIDFICSDLETARRLLPESWGSSSFGRVTKGTALALAGRARLLYASPLFNRTDDHTRWQSAYNVNKEAIEILNAGGFGLAYENNPGLNGAGFSRMFSDYNSEEAVFVTLYNNVHDDNAANEIYRNNRREGGLRPYNSAGHTSSGTTANEMMVELFPMADGKKPTDATGAYTYNSLKFFENREPRFYRTFAFPGMYWRFEGDPFAWTGTLPDNVVYTGDQYVTWNYAWYNDTEKKAADDLGGFGADRLAREYKGVYVRKRSNDFDMASPPICLYRWPSAVGENRQGPFGEGAMPHMEIRYAEVLLNLAEAACGIGESGEAIEILKRIRKRAGYTNESENYGLNVTELQADRGKLFGAILYERQIEFAYEGKRFEDMRRWLLWDGGTAFGQVSGAPASWNLTGYANNTCTYLGVEPLNGKRRDNFELHSNIDAEENHNSDPLKDFRPAALDLKEELGPQFSDLSKFYEDYLVRKKRRGDKEGLVITFQPKYYFIGLTSSAQSNNITLLQTIGWEDAIKGNQNGTFDPLAE